MNDTLLHFVLQRLARCGLLDRRLDAAGTVMLTPVSIAFSPENLQQMKRLGIITFPIATDSSPFGFSIDWQAIAEKDNLHLTYSLNTGSNALLQDVSGGECLNTNTEEDVIVLERKEIDDKIHWFVNGVDKGWVFICRESLVAKIMEILYDQIGHGWVKHRTFMNASAWTEAQYFSASGETGRMQRQLNLIRKRLGVAIIFRKEKGVRFAENVVKSK